MTPYGVLTSISFIKPST